jgi:hypothetical protein
MRNPKKVLDCLWEISKILPAPAEPAAVAEFKETTHLLPPLQDPSSSTSQEKELSNKGRGRSRSSLGKRELTQTVSMRQRLREKLSQSKMRLPSFSKMVMGAAKSSWEDSLDDEYSDEDDWDSNAEAEVNSVSPVLIQRINQSPIVRKISQGLLVTPVGSAADPTPEQLQREPSKLYGYEEYTKSKAHAGKGTAVFGVRRGKCTSLDALQPSGSCNCDCYRQNKSEVSDKATYSIYCVIFTNLSSDY